jgi:hypothetical protein
MDTDVPGTTIRKMRFWRDHRLVTFGIRRICPSSNSRYYPFNPSVSCMIFLCGGAFESCRGAVLLRPFEGATSLRQAYGTAGKIAPLHLDATAPLIKY